MWNFLLIRSVRNRGRACQSKRSSDQVGRFDLCIYYIHTRTPTHLLSWTRRWTALFSGVRRSNGSQARRRIRERRPRRRVINHRPPGALLGKPYPYAIESLRTYTYYVCMLYSIASAWDPETNATSWRERTNKNNRPARRYNKNKMLKNKRNKKMNNEGTKEWKLWEWYRVNELETMKKNSAYFLVPCIAIKPELF